MRVVFLVAKPGKPRSVAASVSVECLLTTGWRSGWLEVFLWLPPPQPASRARTSIRGSARAVTTEDTLAVVQVVDSAERLCATPEELPQVGSVTRRSPVGHNAAPKYT